MSSRSQPAALEADAKYAAPGAPAWLLIAAACLLLAARAWPRLADPEVWQEDGVANLAGFLDRGWADLATPVNGYLIVLPKLLTMAAASASLAWYPAISTLLAWLVTIGLLVFIARAPLQLRGGGLLMVMCLLVPTDPEVFGLPLYTFWWAGIALMATTFWRPSDERIILRALVVVLSSLSSPVCMVTLPLFWARSIAFSHRRGEHVVAAVATATAAMQLIAMWPLQGGGAIWSNSTWLEIVRRFLGSFVFGNLLPAWSLPTGGVLLIFLVTMLWRRRSEWPVWFMAYLLGASILMSVMRVDIGAIHPGQAGPRYFFLPFLLLAWTLLQVALPCRVRADAGIAWAVLALSLLNALPVLTRSHDRLHWARHLRSCAHFDAYAMPVHTDGRAVATWSLELDRATCSRSLEGDRKVGAVPTYAYRTIRGHTTQLLASTSAPAVLEDGWSGSDYEGAVLGIRTLPQSMHVLGSVRSSDADQGRVTVQLRRGDRLLYRTGPGWKTQRILVLGQIGRFVGDPMPSDEWVLLEFSSDLLPDSFDVQFVDAGSGPGEWSAIAFRRERS